MVRRWRLEEGDDVTITGTEAYEAMRAHHQVLGEQLSAGERGIGGGGSGPAA